MNQQDWLIIADGEPLAKAKTHELAKDKTVIALDGALKQCLDYQIIPDLCMGDFDSVEPKLISHAKTKHNIEFIKRPCQNSTDLEKALNYLTEINARHIHICHATGWRLDHSLYNLRLLKRFDTGFKSLQLITNIEKVYFIRDKKIQLQGSPNQAVAIMSFPQAVITSNGLRYDMQQFAIKHGLNESACNSLAMPSANIAIQGEALLLIDPEITLSQMH